MENIDFVIVLIILLSVLLVFTMFVTIQQGMIGVVTVFGKYHRILRPGLNIRIPGIEIVHSKISFQNRSVELSFQATTIDQANVNFKAMLLYSVIDQREETIKNVAFKFVDDASF